MERPVAPGGRRAGTVTDGGPGCSHCRADHSGQQWAGCRPRIQPTALPSTSPASGATGAVGELPVTTGQICDCPNWPITGSETQTTGSEWRG